MRSSPARRRCRSLEEIAADLDYAGDLLFTNIREQAGWSDEAKAAGPKMAALLAAASEPMPPASFTTLTSKGVAPIYGRDEVAITLAHRLAEHLDVTVLLSRPGEIAPPRSDEFPVLKGTIAQASGWLGAFELTVNDYAAPSPSSRGKLVFEAPRNGAVSHCDVVIDVSGGTPLFPAGDLRAGLSAPIRAMRRRSKSPLSRRAGWSASSTSRPMSP